MVHAYIYMTENGQTQKVVCACMTENGQTQKMLCACMRLKNQSNASITTILQRSQKRRLHRKC